MIERPVKEYAFIGFEKNYQTIENNNNDDVSNPTS